MIQSQQITLNRYRQLVKDYVPMADNEANYNALLLLQFLSLFTYFHVSKSTLIST